ncbi:MAG: hypothetical protein Sylvanvirus33_6 [Sylvanvirus sp.]|uniref:Uncharacterized protein n=1 Tax=Sylvanvirus sp. TaxID=2487774 RepID=A0A3G5AJ33_9VIRU|nr:MAG: hypothetical protein Sylvanvirus33_6 [Sylvanvirus sp.]
MGFHHFTDHNCSICDNYVGEDGFVECFACSETGCKTCFDRVYDSKERIKQNINMDLEEYDEDDPSIDIDIEIIEDDDIEENLNQQDDGTKNEDQENDEKINKNLHTKTKTKCNYGITLCPKHKEDLLRECFECSEDNCMKRCATCNKYVCTACASISEGELHCWTCTIKDDKMIEFLLTKTNVTTKKQLMDAFFLQHGSQHKKQKRNKKRKHKEEAEEATKKEQKEQIK